MIADRIRSIQAVSGGGGGGGFDPSQLSGLKLWLKADAGVTVDGSGNVSSWADQSGNGLDAVQLDPAKRPAYTASGIYGLPALSFTGSQTLLGSGSLLVNGVTVFAVAKFNSVSGRSGLFNLGVQNSNSFTRFFCIEQNTYNSNGKLGGYFSGGAYDSSYPSSTQQVRVVASSDLTTGESIAGSTVYRVNGTPQSLSFRGGDASFSGDIKPGQAWMLGDISNGFSYFSGQLSEVIAFDRKLTGVEILQVEEYLHRYGVDPYYDATSLLLNMQGVAGTATFTDESPNALTVTPYGNAQLVADATYGTVASFDGIGDYLDTPNTTALDLPNDFTIEAWFYGIGLTLTPSTIIGKWQNPVAWALLVTTDQIQLATGNSGFYSATHNFLTTIANGVWNHVAISRSGTSIKCFLNGSQIGSTIASSVNLSATSTTDIGRLKSANRDYFNGLIGPTRITKGVARYTANFTPPTGLFPTS